MSDSYLITGGTGSFGSAIVRALLNAKRPERIVVFSRDEHKQFLMRNALPDDPRLRWFLGDVRDRSRLRRAFEGVRYVVHAAAMKHVSAAEYNPGEALRTNCDGTQNVIEAALDAGVQRSLLISTDKAVNPSSLYGATKLVAERLFLAAPALAGSRECQFSVLRCGNLIGSRGSVVPYWRSLVARGTTYLPVTSPQATRYWLDEAGAVHAVLRALHGPYAALTVPEMRAFRVGDLAEAFGMPMRLIGLRPGEKLHEERGDGRDSSSAPRLTVAELRKLLEQHGFGGTAPDEAR